ncbi:MAG: SpoIID/LytB domain-containing protein [Lishizhenia sp.]
MIRTVIVISCVLFLFQAQAQTMRIGVVRSHTVKKMIFSYLNGSYFVLGDTSKKATLLPNEFISLRATSNNQVELTFGVRLLGRFDSIQLLQTGKDYGLRLASVDPKLREKKYLDDFVIKAKNGSLTIINTVQMHHYLSGVVESEGGGGKHLEYYKAQATISRTYAMDRLNRHKREGFQLCDQVHCQAYHNMQRFTPLIDTAVLQTQNVVMKDVHGHLVDGFFHANCGGETTWSDYVWNNRIAYIKPVVDSFCVYTRQANYTTKVLKSDWRNYLVGRLGYPENDSIYGDLLYTFTQFYRKKYYHSPEFNIKLTKIRRKFKLKSTFFSCYESGDYVIIEGRGYGHGVGLCQEGAMKMANLGYSYKQILSFYFSDIEFSGDFEDQFFEQNPELDRIINP